MNYAFLLLLVFANCTIFYLYWYPLLAGCDFSRSGQSSFLSAFRRKNEEDVPFRLLVFADPQLEGDTSLPQDENILLGCLSDHNSITSLAVVPGYTRRLLACFTSRTAIRLRRWRKIIDLKGNDQYLSHIYRTLDWYTFPTHVVVLGDLLGSQWISDVEFDRRAKRFWTIFKGGKPVDERLTSTRTTETLGNDNAWRKRIITVAGNHDIGYSGDIDEPLLNRFERTFGRSNWDIEYHTKNTSALQCLDPSVNPSLRLVILNSMNLDGPPKDTQLQRQTYDFFNDAIKHSRSVEDKCTFTVLLTHIPLHKEAGLCSDGPLMTYYGDGDNSGQLREQNHLSKGSSRHVLQGIYGMNGDRNSPAHGMGRNGIILSGHDHEGCDVYHYNAQNDTDDDHQGWNAVRWADATSNVDADVPGIREATVRSMMGEFQGNAGLLSVWFDEDGGRWRHHFKSCALGVQHIWWVTHTTIYFTGTVSVLYFVAILRKWRTTRSGTARCSSSTELEKPSEVKISSTAPGNQAAT